VTESRECPDCGDALVFAFIDTAGVGAHKRGDSFNTTPDTTHYACLSCAKAWKQRLTGPLTPDIVGELALFTCKHQDCGRPLTNANEMNEATEPSAVELSCPSGHRFRIQQDEHGLSVVAAI
jgi:hypothetical protein